MTEEIVAKVHALGLGLSAYQSSQLLVTAYTEEQASALVAIGFRAGERHQRFPGRAEPGLLIECTYTPATEGGGAVSDPPGEHAAGQT